MFLENVLIDFHQALKPIFTHLREALIPLQTLVQQGHRAVLCRIGFEGGRAPEASLATPRKVRSV